MSPVMIVDDNDDIRFLLGQILKLAGFQVTFSASGPEALSKLGGNDLPQALILDVQMPLMDGWETLAHIRSNPMTSDLPVVLCTVKGRRMDRQHGWELGCDGYVTKPFNAEELVEEVRAAVARTRAQRAAAREAGLQAAREAASA